MPFNYLGEYLARFLKRPARLEIFKFHYKVLLSSVNSVFFNRIIDGHIELWKEYKGQDNYLIGLTFPNCALEGDLSLFFSCNNIRLFTVNFTIAHGALLNIPTEKVVFVGRIQGEVGVIDLIKSATKNLNDICPRTLLFESIQAIAVSLGISDILGICAKEQIASRYNSSVADCYNDYDHFWQKHGGETIGNRLYRFPVPIVQKPLSLIKHNRGRARQRREFRHIIMEQVCATFKKECLLRPIPKECLL